jgi:F-type H+-transporting ATPase subunit b
VELDWTTFVLEIVNFLILVWLLKRFLYRPVLDYIARRRAGIEQMLAEANRTREQAETLKAQYENRLADWAQERQNALDALHHEMDQERARRLTEVKQALAEEQEKARVVEERRQREFSRQAEQAALALAARFASRLLERTAAPQATASLAALLADDLANLPEEQRSALRQAAAAGNVRMRVQSAHPLDAGQRQRLESTLAGQLGASPEWDYQVAPELIAGLRLSFGPWVLGTNLKDELLAFADLAHEPSRP